MAVVDDFGRVTRLSEDLQSLADSLKSSVGKAVEYAAQEAKDSAEKMKVEFDRLVEAMEELGDDVKESLESTRKFVDEVNNAAESVERLKSQKSDQGASNFESVQREQTKILQQILAAHQKAVSDKTAKFTSGSSSLSAARPAAKGIKSASLSEIGFKPRGKDRYAAMLAEGEYVVNEEATRRNIGILDAINSGKIRGFSKGGLVRPEYLAAGSGGYGGRNVQVNDIDGRAQIIISGKYDKDLLEKIKRDFSHLGDDISIEFADKFESRMKTSASRWILGIAAAFTGGGDPFQILFEGAVKDITEFRREMRNLAFQTEGITGNFREAQAEFAKIGENIAGRTGVSVTAFQKAYMNNARKGFKDQKAGMRVLESGLKLSTLIGSETQATAGLFADWHRELGLGAVQMERMANNMQMVARSTGVTGDELISVMKSSEGILKNLRNQGTLTTTAARNVTQAMAEFQKRGFGEEGQKMLSAMSGYSAFVGADKGTQTVLGISAAEGGVDYRDVMFGDVVQDADKMGKMSEGLNKFMARAIGVKPEDFDLDMITSEQRRSLSIALEGMGTSLGAAEAAIDTFKKSAAGLGGQLSEFEKIRKSATATEKEKQEAEKKMNDMLLSSSMDMLGSVTQATEKFGDKTLAEISKELDPTKDTKYSRDFQTGAKDMAALAPYLSDAVKNKFGLSGTAEQMSQQMARMGTDKQMELRSLAAADQLDKAMAAQGKQPQDFSKRMQAALAKGDTKAFKTIAGEMSSAFQESQVKDATSVDPIERLEQTMNELNGTIRSYFSPFIGGILDLIGVMGLLGIQVGMMGSSLYGIFGGNFMKWLKPGNLRETIQGAFGKSAEFFKPFSKGFNRAIASGSSTPQALLRGFSGQFMSQFGAFIHGPMGKMFQKALGPAVLILGGIKGVMEAQDAGRTKTEGAILGALTGGAKTGSFLTGRYGKEAGALDKTLGVAGAAGWGAAAGAAIGASLAPFTAGLSIPAFAAVGAVIGGITEVVKIITEGTDILQNILKPFQVVVDYVYETFKNIYNVIAGIFTLDFGRVFGAIFNQIGSTIALIPRLIMSVLESVFIGLPKLILRTISLIWEIPRMLGQALYDGVASLANNEWVGPIFATFRDAFGAIGEGLMAIWTPISEVFSGVYRVFDDLGKALFGASTGGGLLSGVMWVLQKAVWSLSYVISWLLSPVILLAKALGFVLWIVGKTIQGIIYPFQYLYDVLVGHSIVPDLVFGIIKFFAMLPIRILEFLLRIPVLIGKALMNIPSLIGSMFVAAGGVLGDFGRYLTKAFKKLPKMLLHGMQTVFFDFPSWLMGKLMDGVWAVGNFLVLTLPKIMWQAFKNSLAAVGKFVWDTLSWPFRKIWEFMKWAWESVKQKAMEAWQYITSLFDLGAWASWVSGLGTQIYEGLTSSLQGVWDWIKSWIPGLGTVSKAWENTKGAAGAAWEGVKSTGAKAWEGLKAAGSYLNPFSYFEGYKQGTKKIEKPGLAMLHAGEMVVPKNILEKMSAMGNGVFGSISSMVMGKKGEGGAREGGLISSIFDRIRGMGDMFKSCCPGDAIEGAENAMKGVPKAVAEALNGTNDGSFFGRLKGGFEEASSYTNKFFRPLAVGFKRARKNGDGFLTSISKGMRRQITSMSDKDGVAGSLAGSMDWLSKSIFGVSEGKDTKKGILQRIKEGIFGSKEGENTKKGILDVIKTGLFGEGGEGMKKGIFQIMREGFFGKEGEGGGLYNWIKGKVFGQKMGEGEHGPPKPGLADAAKATAKSLWEGVKTRMEINTEDGMINGAKNAAKSMYGKAKGALFGGKMAEGEFGPPKPGMLDKAKGKIADIYGKAKGKVFGKGPAEAVESAAAADSKVPGKLETFKEKMKNIAEGIKEFSGTKVLAGALNLIPSSVGLVAMIPGSFGARMLAAIDGEKLQKSLEGLGRGVATLGSAKVLAGAAALVAVGVGSIGLIPAIPILSVLGMVGPLVEKGLKSLGKGLSVFGKAAANPYTWLGVLLLGALNVAMIPLAYALRLLSPVIVAFGTAIKSAFEGAGSLLKAVGESIGLILKEITISKALALGVAALGIAALGAAMIAFSGGGFISSWIDYFSGDGLFNKIMEFAAMSSSLMVAATAVEMLGNSFKNFAANKGGGWAEWFAGSDGVIEGFKELSKIGTPEFVATAEAVHKMGEGMEKMHAIPMARPLPGDATTATTPAASSLAPSEGIPSVEPVHLRDITGTILRDRAGTGSNKLQSDELSRMEESAYKQVEELEQIRQGIQELVSLMKPKGGGVAGNSDPMGPGHTKDPRRPMHSARFGKMKFGVPGGLANRSVVNTGEV